MTQQSVWRENFWKTRSLTTSRGNGGEEQFWSLLHFCREGRGQFSQIDCVISSGRRENELHVMGRKSSTDISSELRRLVFSPIFCCTCLSQTKSPRSLPGSRLNNRRWVVGSSKWHRGRKKCKLYLWVQLRCYYPAHCNFYQVTTIIK